MLISQAQEIAHTLSNTEKMPGKSTSLDARKCITGSKLVDVKGSVCEFCYAREGRYAMPNVQEAMAKRLEGISHPLWVPAMVKLVWRQKWFRWHDSGDLQSLTHLRKIVAVCEATPHVLHWLPTKEHGIVKQFLKKGGILPPNLTIRLSAHMRDEVLESEFPTSMVYDAEDVPEGAWVCPAYSGTGEHTCESAGCRECWNKDCKVIAYPFHTKGKVRK
jgi:hypothetical protein